MPCKGCPTEGKQQGWRTPGATTWEAEEIYSVLITLFPTSPWQAWFGWRPWNTSPCLSLFHESSCSRNPRHPFPDSPIAPALLPCASDEQQPGWAGDPMVNHPKAQEENDLTSRRWATTSNVESWFINLPIVKPLQSFSYLYIWGLKYDQWFYIRHGSCLWNWAPLLTTIVSKKSRFCCHHLDPITFCYLTDHIASQLAPDWGGGQNGMPFAGQLSQSAGNGLLMGETWETQGETPVDFIQFGFRRKTLDIIGLNQKQAVSF